MVSSTLQEHGHLSKAWAQVSVDAFEKPDTHYWRLADHAERDQWKLADMDWDTIDFSAVPSFLRQAAADMFAQLHYGELVAMMGAARLVNEGPNFAARLFSSSQVNDEARHGASKHECGENVSMALPPPRANIALEPKWLRFVLVVPVRSK